MADVSILQKENGVIVTKSGYTILKSPSSMEYQLYDLDSEEGSGRNQQGLMMRDRVAIKRKLQCEFPPMTLGELHDWLDATKSQFFTVEYTDPFSGGTSTMEVYVGDRTAPVYMYDTKKSTWLYEKLSMNFIER